MIGDNIHLGLLNIFSHLILTITSVGSYHYYYDPNFTGEETEVLQCSETCQVIQLISLRQDSSEIYFQNLEDHLYTTVFYGQNYLFRDKKYMKNWIIRTEIHSFIHSINVYLLYIMCQALSQAMGTHQQTKENLYSYRVCTNFRSWLSILFSWCQRYCDENQCCVLCIIQSNNKNNK